MTDQYQEIKELEARVEKLEEQVNDLGGALEDASIRFSVLEREAGELESSARWNKDEVDHILKSL